jgi:hypothetical protein
MDKVPKKTNFSINYSNDLFSLLDLLTNEEWTERLTCNTGTKLSLYTV